MSAKTLAYLAPTVLLFVATILAYFQYRADEEKWRKKAAEAYRRGSRDQALSNTIRWTEAYHEGRQAGREEILEQVDTMYDLAKYTEGSKEDFRRAFLELRKN